MNRLAEAGVPGFCGVVGAIDDASPFCRRLRELGIREGEEVEWVSGHDPVLLRCGASRLAVCREMLHAVFVCRCRNAGCGLDGAQEICPEPCGSIRRMFCRVTERAASLFQKS